MKKIFIIVKFSSYLLLLHSDWLNLSGVDSPAIYHAEIDSSPNVYSGLASSPMLYSALDTSLGLHIQENISL